MANKNTKKTNQTVIEINKKSIAILVLMIASLIALIGVFGSTIKVTSSSTIDYVTTSSFKEYGLKMIFSEVWENIRRMEDIGSTKGLIVFCKLIAALNLVSFFVALLSIIVIGCVSAYKIYNKKQISLNRAFALLIALTIQYPLFQSITMAISDRRSSSSNVMLTNSSFGWGSILIIVAFFIGLVGLLINESADSRKITSVGSVSSKIAILLVFFIGLFGLTKLTCLTINYGSGSRYVTNYSSLDLLSSFLRINSEVTKEISSGTIKSSFAFVLQMISFGFLIYVIYSLFKNDLNKNGLRTIFYAIFYTLTNLASSLLTTSALKTYYTGSSSNNTITLGSSAIVSIVLGTLLVISVIASINLQNKTVKFVKSK